MNYQEFKKIAGEISVRYETGGASGGNCWDGVASYYSTGKEYEGIKDIKSEIENILILIDVDFNFLTYIKLCKLLEESVTHEDYCENDWYGNFEEGYDVRLDSKDLYDALINVGIL